MDSSTKNPLAESSAALVKRIASGDQAAEEELVRTYSGRVHAIAVARTRDREVARDLTQDVLLAVIKALRAKMLRDADKLESFIQGTAKNLINNYFRTRVRRSETSLEAANLNVWDGVLESEAAERSRLVQQELEQCNTLDQQILLFSVVDGHSLAEVAKRLGMSYDAVRARKSRLVRKMEEKLGRMSQKLGSKPLHSGSAADVRPSRRNTD
jgi:RNA polymerase sigma-70 factor (ECF subfamily)